MTPLTKQLYFTTSTVIDWVDIFTRASYRHIVIESLDYCQRQKDNQLSFLAGRQPRGGNIHVGISVAED